MFTWAVPKAPTPGWSSPRRTSPRPSFPKAGLTGAMMEAPSKPNQLPQSLIFPCLTLVSFVLQNVRWLLIWLAVTYTMRSSTAMGLGTSRRREHTGLDSSPRRRLLPSCPSITSTARNGSPSGCKRFLQSSADN